MDRAQLLDAIDTLLTNDSDLVGAQELTRLALARELIGLGADRGPAITAFLDQVSAEVAERTADLSSPCIAGGVHTWELWESGHARRWPTVTIQLDGDFDVVEAVVTGPVTHHGTGTGLTLLRCTQLGCRTERYVPFEWDLGWDEA